jgi:tetratricopeptide (TPR) repeat protein
VTLRNYLVEKDFVLIAGNLGFNFYSGNNPKATGTFYCPDNITLNQEDMFRDARIIARIELGREVKASGVSGFWFNKAIEFIRREPWHYLKLLWRKITYLLNPDEPVHDLEFYFIQDKIRIFKIIFMNLKFIMPLGILGALLGLKDFKKAVFLYLILITLSLSIILFFVTTMYRVAMVPFLIIFSSHSLVSLWNALKGKNYLRFCRLCSLLILISALLFYNKILNRNINRSLQNNFSDYDYHLLKAQNYENKGDYPRAMQEVNSAYRINPLDRRVLFRLGVNYFYMQDFKAAEDKFKEVIKVCPFCVDAYYNLGFLYNQKQRFLEAIEALEKSVYLDPENIAANFELGMAYKSVGKMIEAKQKFGLALQNISRWRTKDREIIEKELAGLK